jgi:hypothetical protein
MTYVEEDRELESLLPMPSTLQIDITESEATLKTLVQQQSSARHKERLQALYHTIAQLEEALFTQINGLSRETITSLTGYSYSLEAPHMQVN